MKIDPHHSLHINAFEQDAEESHTAVGVHRLAPRVGEPMVPGRGVLEQPGTNSSSRSRRGEGRGGGGYELVETRERGERKQDGDDDVSNAAAAGIRRVVSG